MESPVIIQCLLPLLCSESIYQLSSTSQTLHNQTLPAKLQHFEKRLKLDEGGRVCLSYDIILDYNEANYALRTGCLAELQRMTQTMKAQSQLARDDPDNPVIRAESRRMQQEMKKRTDEIAAETDRVVAYWRAMLAKHSLEHLMRNTNVNISTPNLLTHALETSCIIFERALLHIIEQVSVFPGMAQLICAYIIRPPRLSDE